MRWLCLAVASTHTHWHFEERSTGSPIPTAVSLCTDSFVSRDSDCWSTFVTYELPCQCINTGCLNWQEISSKYLTFQPRARFHSIVPPAGAGGSWKRMYKHGVQTEHASKSLTYLEMVCFVLSDSVQPPTDTDNLHGTERLQAVILPGSPVKQYLGKYCKNLPWILATNKLYSAASCRVISRVSI